MGAVYSRWLDQYEDEQLASGASNNYVPALQDTSPGAPNWQTAYTTLVWVLQHYYGDTAAAEKHHDSLVRYYDNLEAGWKATGCKGFHQGAMFGDWVPAG